MRHGKYKVKFFSELLPLDNQNNPWTNLTGYTQRNCPAGSPNGEFFQVIVLQFVLSCAAVARAAARVAALVLTC